MQSLGTLFRDVFSRNTPHVDGKTYTLSVASLLRFHQIDAIQVIDSMKPEKQKEYMFVFGYSILVNLIKQDPKNYYNFVFEPCIKNSLHMQSVSSEQTPNDLLDSYLRSGFGFACLERGKIVASVTLHDFLELYKKRSAYTDMLLKEVLSHPIQKVSGQTSVKETIKLMINKRMRKVLNEEGKIISDRDIISYIFSPSQLERFRNAPSSLLDPPVSEIDGREPAHTSSDTSVVEAARILNEENAYTIVCEDGVVTPWDAVMKPFVAGRLHFVV